MSKHTLYTIIFTLICCLMFLSCLHKPTYDYLPKPKKVVKIDNKTKKKYFKPKIQENSYRDMDLDYMFKMSIVKNHTSIENYEKIFYNLFKFLINTFGSPIILKHPINIEFRDNISLSNHAITKVGPDNNRRIIMSTHNLFEDQRHFIIHELFHSFYQTSSMLKMAEHIVEGWATYAQYKYKYYGKSNSEIRLILKKRYSISKNDINSFSSTSWSTLPQNKRIKAYIVSSLKLFSNEHMNNYIRYRSMLKSSTNIASSEQKHDFRKFEIKEASNQLKYLEIQYLCQADTKS